MHACTVYTLLLCDLDKVHEAKLTSFLPQLFVFLLLFCTLLDTYLFRYMFFPQAPRLVPPMGPKSGYYR